MAKSLLVLLWMILLLYIDWDVICRTGCFWFVTHLWELSVSPVEQWFQVGHPNDHRFSRPRWKGWIFRRWTCRRVDFTVTNNCVENGSSRLFVVRPIGIFNSRVLKNWWFMFSPHFGWSPLDPIMLIMEKLEKMNPFVDDFPVFHVWLPKGTPWLARPRDASQGNARWGAK